MNPYRRRVWSMFQRLLDRIGHVDRSLDYGSGDGWFAQQVQSSGRVKELVPIEVLKRDRVLVEPVLFDGVRLPFPDRTFDLAYAVDVLHHCPDPTSSLRDLLRVTGKYFLLKDHTWNTKAGKCLLGVLDELGNRRFGVPCAYKHQCGWEWDATLRAEGFDRVELIHPARCHVGGMWWVNRFEFIALWRRVG